MKKYLLLLIFIGLAAFMIGYATYKKEPEGHYIPGERPALGENDEWFTHQNNARANPVK